MWVNPASKPVLCLLAAALALRIGAALTVQYWLDNHWKRRFVIEGDAEGYWMLGRAIAEGAPYAAYEPPRYIMRMPGFPLLLAVPIRLSGGNFLAARLFLAVIGTAACGLVYLLGRDLSNERIGLLAGWFTALSPALVGFSVMILSETPFALGILASLWGMTRLMRSLAKETIDLQTVVGWSIFTGAAIALATFMRPSWLAAAVLIPLGLILARGLRRESLFAGGVIAATVLFGLLPWGIRNHNVTGHWVFTTLWSGPSLYDGLNPAADGSSNMQFMIQDDLAPRMSEYHLNQHYWEKGVDFAKGNPGRAMELAFAKLYRYWKIWPSAAEAGNLVVRLAISVFTLALFAGALYGIWINRRNLALLALTLGPVLFFAALHAVFVGSIRYRLPAEYPLAVIAAAGWCRIISAKPKPGGDAP